MDVAIIESQTGSVVTVVSVDEIFDPGDGLIAVDVTGVVAYAGCTWSEEGGFVEPAKPAPTTDELIAHAAARRWQVETAGITAGGVMVATDDRSKSLIMGARMAADKDPGFTTRFKPVGGGFVTVDAPAIIAISDALLAHVAACFAIEAQVVADIDAGIITTTAEIDAAGWPGS